MPTLKSRGAVVGVLFWAIGSLQISAELTPGSPRHPFDTGELIPLEFEKLSNPTDLAVEIDAVRGSRFWVLTSVEEFNEIVGQDLPPELDFERYWAAVHTGKKSRWIEEEVTIRAELDVDWQGLVFVTQEFVPYQCPEEERQRINTLWMFEIPEQPVHQFHRYEHYDDRICGPSQEELLGQLQSSLETWHQLGWTRYSYSQEDVSFIGTRWSTEFTVEDSKVVRKVFSSFSTVTGPGEDLVETGGSIGTNDAAHPTRTIDDHYELCAQRIGATDPRITLVTLRFDDLGLLAKCLVTPMDCQDDCSEGASIYDLKLSEPMATETADEQHESSSSP